MQPRWTWQHAALAGLVLLTGLGATSLVASAVARCDEGPPALLGLRLGLTPDMLRDRYPDASFRTELGEDVSLIADAPLAHGVEGGARFEFHDGQLVAVRAILTAEHPEARGDRLVATPGTVLFRGPSSSIDATREGRDGVEVRLLARTCPTHHDEAEGLVATFSDRESSDLP
jgi:hypothetical protein